MKIENRMARRHGGGDDGPDGSRHADGRRREGFPSDQELKLIAVLQSMPRPEKAITCKQLAVYGAQEAIPRSRRS